LTGVPENSIKETIMKNISSQNLTYARKWQAVTPQKHMFAYDLPGVFILGGC